MKTCGLGSTEQIESVPDSPTAAWWNEFRCMMSHDFRAYHGRRCCRSRHLAYANRPQPQAGQSQSGADCIGTSGEVLNICAQEEAPPANQTGPPAMGIALRLLGQRLFAGSRCSLRNHTTGPFLPAKLVPFFATTGCGPLLPTIQSAPA
jgi:hypothetical protein